MSEAIALLTPDALEKVLTKDVEELGDEDIQALISHYRAERKEFLQNERMGKPARKISATSNSPPSAKKELAAKIADLDLGDL